MTDKTEKIGRYEIVGNLGEGAMATVSKAFDPEINRTLAIKLLRDERCEDKEYRYRFLREAEASGNLTHPNIVTVYDIGEVNNQPYIAMELLEGETLDKIMESGERLQMTEIIGIGIQLADALGYAHARGIVHRDIKPSNIIRYKERNNIKITDFGIAHMESTNIGQKTRIGMVLGTPQYMSPEQVMGLEVDGRSDLFSVGVILYQLITGEKPFRADTLNSLYFQIMNDEPEPISKKVPDVDPAIRAVVKKLLKKKPQQRYQTGAELASDLSRILHDLKVRQLEEGQPRIIPIRIKWSIAMAVIVTITMLVGLSFAYSKQYQSMASLAQAYGSSLAKFIAFESAEAILIGDWVSIETFVRETQERQQFNDLIIVDHNGAVRGSTDTESAGTPYRMPENTRFLHELDGAEIYDQQMQGSDKAFYFVTPILFQDKEIGRVYLSLSQSSLQGAADLTVLMMIALMIVTVSAVVTVAYLLAHRLSAPIRTLKRSLNEIAHKNFDYRISEQRNDEFGQLYAGFNQMADSLQGPAQQDIEHTRVALPEGVADPEPASQDGDATRVIGSGKGPGSMQMDKKTRD